MVERDSQATPGEGIGRVAIGVGIGVAIGIGEALILISWHAGQPDVDR